MMIANGYELAFLAWIIVILLCCVDAIYSIVAAYRPYADQPKEGNS